MKKFVPVLCAVMLATPAQADHHGRGQEQLNGFPGIYDVGPGRATFTDDGYLVISTNSANVAAAIWRYEVADGVMRLRDVSPPAFLPAAARDCMRENWASFSIVDVEDGFRLETIEDACAQRAGLLTSGEFHDYVRPE